MAMGAKPIAAKAMTAKAMDAIAMDAKAMDAKAIVAMTAKAKPMQNIFPFYRFFVTFRRIHPFTGMMKCSWLLVLALLMNATVFGKSPADSLLQVLDRELVKADTYLEANHRQITRLKQQLEATTASSETRFRLLDSIFEGYKSVLYDSAFHYVQRMQEVAYQIGNPSHIVQSRIKMGFIFISSGMFKEATDTLLNVGITTIPGSLKADYYAVLTILYYGMSDLQDAYYSPIYEQQAYTYTDSILAHTGKDSYTYLYYRGLRHIRKGEYQEGRRDLETVLGQSGLTLHQKAIINSTLSDIYINLGEQEQAIELLAKASIFDIRSATRETSAILNLANILYNRGDIQRSYTYTRRALEDANYYGARHRKIQVGQILPIIEEEKINTVESQRRLLLIYSIALTALAIVIIGFIIALRRQYAKLKKAEIKIMETNQALVTTNQHLVEANRIKEEYIGYYFNQISNYIDKIENLQTSIEKSLAANKFDTVRYIVHNINLKKERTNLYQGFDKVFLSLFPDFIKNFNALFKEEDRMVLPDNELLNTDLRIFALIRLGINENDKIANILGFSVNTIYTYKTRIKNKSTVPNEEFEKRIMEIRVM